MIVKNNQKTNTNDDAHYLTFNNTGVYESDANGISQNGNFIKYVKDDNNLHCYSGKGYHGYAQYFFSNDYNRLNVKIDNSTTYVYQVVTNNTNVKYRPNSPSPTVNNGGTPSYTNPGSTTIPNQNNRTRTKTREQCNFCHGTGIGTNFIEKAPQYTTTTYYEWCDDCKAYTERHYHKKTRCGKCNGKGYVEY